MFYLALGYFISYLLLYALLASSLSRGIVAGVDRSVGGAVLPAAGPRAQAVTATARSGQRRTVASAGVEVDAPVTLITDLAHAILLDAGLIAYPPAGLAPERFP